MQARAAENAGGRQKELAAGAAAWQSIFTSTTSGFVARHGLVLGDLRQQYRLEPQVLLLSPLV